MTQEFQLLVLNQQKAARLLWGYMVFLALVGGLFATHHPDAAFGLLIAFPIGLGIVLSFRDKLVGEACQVCIAPNQLTLFIPATDERAAWPFAQLRSYRIVPTKGSVILQARTLAGERLRLGITYSREGAAMLQAFEQALRRYQATTATAPILRELGFFERPISTRVLGWLFATSAAGVVWGIGQAVPPVVYGLPIGTILLTYIAVWAMYSDKRP